MAGKAHQKICGLIARKMRQEGFEIVSLDGKELLISAISLNIPPFIKRHKPDLIGINFVSKRLSIGEAKTASDLQSLRTKEQLLDFSSLITKSGETINLVIGIPQSAENELLKLLKSFSLLNKPQITYIWVPDVLLENGDNKESL